MKLFQYAIIYVPKENDSNKSSGAKAKVLVPITECLAEDQNGATILAARAIPEEYIDRLDEVQVVTRPF